MPAEVIAKPSPPLPVAGEFPVLPPEAGTCANCGHSLQGPFCSACGQHVADFHRSIWRFVVDFVDNFFGWDNKVFRTLRPLLTQPGAVTLDYLSGRRVRYVHPLRLFLFTSAICLAIIHHFGGTPLELKVNKDAPKDQPSHKGFSFHLNGAEPAPSPGAVPVPTPEPSTPDASPPAADAAPSPAKQRHGKQADSDAEEMAKGIKIAAGIVQEIKAAATGDKDAAGHGQDAKSTPPSPNGKDFEGWIERTVNAKLKTPEDLARFQNELSESVQRRIPWMVLAVLPVFAMVLRALYWRQDSYYFAHLIFSLHYHTFLLLLWASDVVLKALTPSWLSLLHLLLNLAVFVPGVYLFLALRRMYGEGIKRTVTKVLMIGAMHLLLLVSGLAIIGMTGVFGALF